MGRLAGRWVCPLRAATQSEAEEVQEREVDRRVSLPQPNISAIMPCQVGSWTS
jgi:hypothetical protein